MEDLSTAKKQLKCKKHLQGNDVTGSALLQAELAGSVLAPGRSQFIVNLNFGAK